MEASEVLEAIAEQFGSQAFVGLNCPQVRYYDFGLLGFSWRS